MQNYILLTAAKNEEACIGECIESVVSQSQPPAHWIIIDDGSNDHTAEIIRDAARQHFFIQLIGEKPGKQRSFGSKDRVIQAAYEIARKLKFGFVGVHDADISLESSGYYASLLQHFDQNAKLGIAGGYIYERSVGGGDWKIRWGNSRNSVAGAIQMFRRECFEQIGGFQYLPYGGSDWLTQVHARMKGWEVRSFPQYMIRHHRPTSTADGWIRGYIRQGFADASFGSDPVFEVFKCAKRIRGYPILFGAAARFSGYLWWKLSGRAPLIDPPAVAFLRSEQRKEIARIFLRHR